MATALRSSGREHV